MSTRNVTPNKPSWHLPEWAQNLGMAAVFVVAYIAGGWGAVFGGILITITILALAFFIS
jgi:hypothetical protein